MRPHRPITMNEISDLSYYCYKMTLEGIFSRIKEAKMEPRVLWMQSNKND